MKIALTSLHIENFKGIKKFSIEPQGKNVTLLAENGAGKTSVYDAFLWLLFGKDSSGRKQFDIRPLDKKNQPIEGLTVSVTGTFDVGGTKLVLRKNHIEKIVKKTITGFSVECWVDEVPKKVSDYDSYVASIISEDVFKLLTDLHFFSEKLHWSDRRKVLLDMAGNIKSPDGFEALLAEIGTRRTIEEYKSVLAEQRKLLVKENSEINPRMDEIQRGLDAYAGDGDTADAENERDVLKLAIANVDAERKKLIASDQLRTTMSDTINSLKAQRGERALRLASLGHESAYKEKAAIEADLEKRRQTLRDARSAAFAKTQDVAEQTKKIELNRQSLNDVRERYTKAKNAPLDATCYACGQKLPADKLGEIEKKREDSLAAISKEGAGIKKSVTTLQSQLESLLAEKKALTESVDKAAILVQEAEANKVERFDMLDKQIAENKINPANDPEWLMLGKKVAELEKEIGEPAGEQLTKLDAARNGYADNLQKINTTLANADNAKKAAVRLKELAEKEKELAAKIAEVDGRLADIDKYKTEQSKLIEAAVNGLFKHVNFKLFKTLMNGSIEDTCEAMLNGIPYAECSYGQKILMGVDIVNVLSSHYQTTVTLFIDNAEGLTYKLETLSQTVRMAAMPGHKEIKVLFGDAAE